MQTLVIIALIVLAALLATAVVCGALSVAFTLLSCLIEIAIKLWWCALIVGIVYLSYRLCVGKKS